MPNIFVHNTLPLSTSLITITPKSPPQKNVVSVWPYPCDWLSSGHTSCLSYSGVLCALCLHNSRQAVPGSAFPPHSPLLPVICRGGCRHQNDVHKPYIYTVGCGIPVRPGHIFRTTKNHFYVSVIFFANVMKSIAYKVFITPNATAPKMIIHHKFS